MARRPPAFRMLLGALSACCLLLANAATGWAQAARQDPPSLVEKLRGAISEAGLAEQVGVSVVNLRSGREVFGHHASMPRNPASNMKLITAAVALLELGPEYQMRTALYGHQEGDAIVGGLYLRGFGDPTLSAGDLIAMGQQLVRRGIRRVDEVLVDSTYFDDQILPPAFEQQPNEAAPFRAAVSAVSVNRNAFELRVAPGSAAGKPARVMLDAPGYFQLDNQATTSPGGAPKIIAIQGADGAKQVLKLRGSVPLGITGVSYYRRVESPDQYAGHVLVEALKALRVQVPRRVGIGPTSNNAALLVEWRSPTLSRILYALGKRSDNFVAEMLLKVLAAEKVGTPASSEAGVPVVLKALQGLGVPVSKLKIVNGSGLFDGNEVAPEQLTALLAAMYKRTDLRPDYLAQLAIGGVDGTLARRMPDLPVRGVVRAKTGTLAGVIALSGYVLAPSPERGFAFSFLANGVEGKHHAARSLADRLATILAKYLHP